MEKPLYAWIRVKRLTSFAAVACAAKHGRRTGRGVEHVDLSATPDNRAFSLYSDDPLDLVSAVRRAAEIQNATFRRSASPAMHLLIHLSPEWFTSTNPDVRFDREKVEIYWREALAWLTKEFGPAFASARLDLDESTPHVDAFVTPASDRLTKGGRKKREVSVRDRFGTRRSLELLQTSFADHMKKFGFKRGKPKNETGRINRPFRDFHLEVMEREKKAELRNQALQVAMDVISRRLFSIRESKYYPWACIELRKESYDQEALRLLANMINSDQKFGRFFVKLAMTAYVEYEDILGLENMELKAYIEGELIMEPGADPSYDLDLLNRLYG